MCLSYRLKYRSPKRKVDQSIVVGHINLMAMGGMDLRLNLRLEGKILNFLHPSEANVLYKEDKKRLAGPLPFRPRVVAP